MNTDSESLSFSQLHQRSKQFAPVLDKQKQDLARNDFWYPYGTLSNFQHLLPFDECGFKLPKRTGSRIADVGGADGDLSFFLSTLGYEAHIIDYGPTNYNNLQGAKLLADAHYRNVKIHEFDLDGQFQQNFSETFDIIFFLGILYHLKNPFYILEQFSKSSRYMFLSTRVAKHYKRSHERRSLFSKNINVSDYATAYLLGPQEANNDPTNYWIFSITGLQRILDRTGWEVVKMYTVGDRLSSNQMDNHHDERAFCLLKSKSYDAVIW